MSEPKSPARLSADDRIQVLLVAGMERSGTSALAGALGILGWGLPNDSFEATEFNEEGYFESQALIDFFDEVLAAAGTREIAWEPLPAGWQASRAATGLVKRGVEIFQQVHGDQGLVVLKNPRISKLLPFTLRMMAELDADVKILLPFRSPIEVANSESQHRGLSLAPALLMWLRYNLDAEVNSRGLPRMFIDHNAFLDGWPKVVARIERQLDVAMPRRGAVSDAEVASFLDPSLKHNASGPDALAAAPFAERWIAPAFTALRNLCADPDDAAAMSALDLIRQDFNAGCDVFGVVARDLEARLSVKSAEADLNHDHWHAADQDVQRFGRLVEEKDGTIGALNAGILDLERALEDSHVNELRLEGEAQRLHIQIAHLNLQIDELREDVDAERRRKGEGSERLLLKIDEKLGQLISAGAEAAERASSRSNHELEQDFLRATAVMEARRAADQEKAEEAERKLSEFQRVRLRLEAQNGNAEDKIERLEAEIRELDRRSDHSQAGKSGAPGSLTPPFVNRAYPPIDLKNSIAVLVCCYSGEAYFEDTMKSIERQTYKHIHVVIHDNGCASSYKDKIDLWVKKTGATLYVSDTNRYGEGLRYDVLPYITQKYIAVLHDDDVYHEEKIAISMRRILKDKLDYIFTDRKFIDSNGHAFQENPEGLNSKDFEVGEFPYRLGAELFYTGLRLHFSTMVMKTELVRRNFLGDPYVPRIADALFFVKTIFDRSLKGDYIGERLTDVRIHGANDFLYGKFETKRQLGQLTELSLAEYYAFEEIIRAVDDDQLIQILAAFPGIPVEAGDTRVGALVKAAIWLRPWHRSKKLMSAFCLHEAFKLDPFGAMEAARRWLGSEGGDANVLMRRLYGEYTDGEALFHNTNGVGRTLAFASDDQLRAALDEMVRSTSWRLTAPLRSIGGVVKRVGVLPKRNAAVLRRGPAGARGVS